MLGEVGGGCNFDNMVKMFQEKMAGGSNDPDDLFGEFEVDDDGFIASKDVIGLFVAGGGEEMKEEAPAAPVEEAPAEAPAEEGDGDGAKKKKKKKKAAK